MLSAQIRSNQNQDANRFTVNEKRNNTLMKNFTQNAKIILNFFPYLLKKIYFKA